MSEHVSSPNSLPNSTVSSPPPPLFHAPVSPPPLQPPPACAPPLDRISVLSFFFEFRCSVYWVLGGFGGGIGIPTGFYCCRRVGFLLYFLPPKKSDSFRQEPPWILRVFCSHGTTLQHYIGCTLMFAPSSLIHRPCCPSSAAAGFLSLMPAPVVIQSLTSALLQPFTLPHDQLMIDDFVKFLNIESLFNLVGFFERIWWELQISASYAVIWPRSSEDGPPQSSPAGQDLAKAAPHHSYPPFFCSPSFRQIPLGFCIILSNPLKLPFFFLARTCASQPY